MKCKEKCNTYLKIEQFKLVAQPVLRPQEQIYTQDTHVQVI